MLGRVNYRAYPRRRRRRRRNKNYPPPPCRCVDARRYAALGAGWKSHKCLVAAPLPTVTLVPHVSVLDLPTRIGGRGGQGGESDWTSHSHSTRHPISTRSQHTVTAHGHSTRSQHTVTAHGIQSARCPSRAHHTARGRGGTLTTEPAEEEEDEEQEQEQEQRTTYHVLLFL